MAAERGFLSHSLNGVVPEADRIEGEFSRADRARNALVGRCVGRSVGRGSFFRRVTFAVAVVNRGRKLFCVFVMSESVGPNPESGEMECQLDTSIGPERRLIGRSVGRGNSNITHSSSCSFSRRNSTQSFMPFLSPDPDNVRELATAWERTARYNWEGGKVLHIRHRPAHSLTNARHVHECKVLQIYCFAAGAKALRKFEGSQIGVENHNGKRSGAKT